MDRGAFYQPGRRAPLADRHAIRSWLEPSPANALRLVLAGALVAILAWNLPGHLSYDSVIALEEGSTGVRQSWAPAAYAWILGRFDDVIAGTGLYVTASAAMLVFALMALAGLRPRVSWAAPVVALALTVTPQVLVYQGIVWKDVLFANLSVAAFVALAVAARDWETRRRWDALAFALVALAFAALVRQQGLIMAPLAALALGWTARSAGWRRALAWGFGGLAAVVLLSVALNAAVEPKPGGVKARPDAGMRILRHYDIVGAKAHDPGLPLTEMARADPARAAIVAASAARAYSPQRIDTLEAVPALGPALWRTGDEAIAAQWRAIILKHPRAYLAHRYDAFRWVFATPEIDRCLPVHLGVAGPPEMMARMRLTPGVDTQDQAEDRWASRFYGTPVFSHVAWAVLALLTSGLLFLRRDPADYVVAALQLAALGFTASFFVVSVACDYRYLYAMDLAAMAGLLYLAIDPPVAEARRLFRRP